MLIKQELIDKIKDYFGLNVYETKVWLALLRKGIASAGEIATISRVPRSRTYDVLESLEKKGFTIVKIGKPVKYIGIRPQIILERLKNNVRKEASEKTNYLHNIKNTEEFWKLEELYKNGISPVNVEELSLALKGKTNISNFLRGALKNAKEEVIICGDAQEIKMKMRLFQQTFKSLKNANVKIKFALFGDSKLITQIENELGIKIKKINFNAKFFIIDKKEILFYLSKSSEEDFAIWLNSEFFVGAFAHLFEKALGKK